MSTDKVMIQKKHLWKSVWLPKYRTVIGIHFFATDKKDEHGYKIFKKTSVEIYAICVYFFATDEMDEHR